MVEGIYVRKQDQSGDIANTCLKVPDILQMSYGIFYKTHDCALGNSPVASLSGVKNAMGQKILNITQCYRFLNAIAGVQHRCTAWRIGTQASSMHGRQSSPDLSHDGDVLVESDILCI